MGKHICAIFLHSSPSLPLSGVQVINRGSPFISEIQINQSVCPGQPLGVVHLFYLYFKTPSLGAISRWVKKKQKCYPFQPFHKIYVVIFCSLINCWLFTILILILMYSFFTEIFSACLYFYSFCYGWVWYRWRGWRYREISTVKHIWLVSSEVVGR